MKTYLKLGLTVFQIQILYSKTKLGTFSTFLMLKELVFFFFFFFFVFFFEKQNNKITSITKVKLDDVNCLRFYFLCYTSISYIFLYFVTLIYIFI